MAPSERIATQELLIALDERGVTVTSAQLARWHRAGLIAKPERRSAGRGAGSVSLYPKRTLQQATNVAQLRTVHPTMRLDEVAWRLWWSGRDVEFDAVQDQLDQLALGLDAERNRLAVLVRAAAEGDEHAADELEAIRMAVQTGNVPSDNPLHAARSRIGDAVSSVVQVLIEIGTGTFVGFPEKATDSDVEQEFEEALQLDRARLDSYFGAAPWLAGRVEDDLIRLSGMIGSVQLADIVRGMSRDELAAHRRLTKPLLDGIAAFAALSATFLDRDAFGLTALGDANDSAEGQQLYLLGTLVLAGDARLRRGMRTIAAATNAFPDPLTVFSYLRRLRSAAPGRALHS